MSGIRASQMAATETAARAELTAPSVSSRIEPEPIVTDRYGPRDYWGRRALAVSDAAAVLVALVVTALVPTGREDHRVMLLVGLPLALLSLPIFRAYGMYDRDAKRISHTTVDDLPAIFHSLLVLGLLWWAWFHIAPVEDLRFIEIATFVLSAGWLLVVLRATARISLAQRMGPERTIIVGAGPSARALVRKMKAHPEYGVVPVAMLHADGLGGTTLRHASLDGGSRFRHEPTITDDVDLTELATELKAERLILSPGDIDGSALFDMVFLARQLKLKLSLLPNVEDALGPSVEIDEIEGVTLLAVNPPVLSRSSRAMKRGLDVVGAGLGLLAMVPVFAIVAVAIKLDSRGPVFFRQSRVGRRGERFGVLKFRTMCTDAEAQRAALLEHSKDANWLHLDDDPRITRVGRILRNLSIDELPQLWNVLRGDMSLVGPRPLIEDEDCRVDGYARHRLDLTPGMTGLWQVLGRTRIPFEEMVKLDYLYVTNWTLWGDIRLLLKTVGVVLQRQGAN